MGEGSKAVKEKCYCRKRRREEKKLMSSERRTGGGTGRKGGHMP